MKTVLLLTVLFSVSFVPEVADADFTFELRPFAFAVVICALVFVIGIMGTTPSWRASLLKKAGNWNEFSLIDMVYATYVGMTVVFLFLTSAEARAFHFAFVSVGMFLVYIFFRGIFCHSDTENTEKEKSTMKDNTHHPNGHSSQAGIYSFQWLMFLIIVVSFANALIGVAQFFCGKKVIGIFGAESFFGCFLAMNGSIVFGLGLAILKKKGSSYWSPLKRDNFLVISYRFIKWFSVVAFVIILAVIVLTKSRTALIGLVVVLPLMYLRVTNYKLRFNKLKISFRIGIFAFLFLLAIPCIHFFYKLKPMSAVGRTLIWKVSADMFLKNPVSGVGFGNFANQYNLYQADFFISEKGSVINKMTAGQVRHAYNWYLETAAEFGIFGLIVFGIFWWLILREVYKFFKPHKEHKNTEVNYLNLGMAGSVLCFMIMCLFQFPNKIIPTYIIFNVALAWIVNANLEENNKIKK